MLKYFSGIKYVLSKKEINKLYFIFFLLLLVSFLDAISFAFIIPVFNVIFLNKTVDLFYLNLKFSDSFDYKFLVLILFFLFFIFKNIIIIIFNYYFVEFFKKINNRIGSVITSNFIHQEFVFYLKETSKDFFQKILKDLYFINNYFISSITVISEIVFFFLVSLVLIYVNFTIFCFVFFSFLIFIILYTHIFKKKLIYWSYQYRDSSLNLNNLTAQGLVGFKDIVIYGLKNYFNIKLNQSLRELNHFAGRIVFLNNVQKYWLEMVAVFIILLGFIYLIYFKVPILELIPVLSVFVLVILRFITSLNRLIMNFQNISFYYPSYQSIVDECRKNESSTRIEISKKFNFDNYIEFFNVSFGYNNFQNNLNHVNFKIYKNQCVGIFGDNGSGKSTLLNLIAGLLEPSKGKITIDGKINLYENRDFWHTKISYVQQDIFLLDESIYFNIFLQNKCANLDLKLIELNNIFNLEKYFLNQPHGLNTKVERNGINLSGGQKQIISIARAIYKNSDVLLFDEPTSAMDATNSLLIKDLIHKLKNNKTIILTTHDKTFFTDLFDVTLKVDKSNIRIT